MDITVTAQRVEHLFSELDRRVDEFRRRTGIACPGGCARCCEYPRIETSVLEFVPLAKFLWDTERAETLYRSIAFDNPICILLAPPSLGEKLGRCTIYKKRGLLCRVFGFLAVPQDQGQYSFQTCSALRTTHAEAIARLCAALLRELPHASACRRRFEDIAPDLGRRRLPVNQAIKQAIEVVYESGYSPLPVTGLPRAA